MFHLGRWRRTASSVLLAGFLSSTSLYASGGLSAATSPPDNHLQRDAVARQIQDVVSKSRLDGFTGLSLQGSTLVLYWKGSVPQAVASVIATRPASVQMVVRNARFSLTEMDARERHIVAANKSVFGGKIVWIGLPGDYGAIQIAFDTTLVNAADLNALQNQVASISSPIFRSSCTCTAIRQLRMSAGQLPAALE